MHSDYKAIKEALYTLTGDYHSYTVEVWKVCHGDWDMFYRSLDSFHILYLVRLYDETGSDWDTLIDKVIEYQARINAKDETRGHSDASHKRWQRATRALERWERKQLQRLYPSDCIKANLLHIAREAFYSEYVQPYWAD